VKIPVWTTYNPIWCFYLLNPQRYTEGRRGWKPITLRAPILGGFIIFSLAIILVLELLYSKSVECGDMNDGGVAFATDSNEVSVLTTFG